MFRIEFTLEALDDLSLLRAYDQRRVIEEIETQLLHEPATETRRRKRLRPNLLAEWELRIEDFRVFYDVTQTDEGDTVKIVAIGHKVGNTLFIHGEQFEL